MADWLKLIGSATAAVTEAPFHGNYTAEHVGFRKANKPGIREDDHLFLYASGGGQRIFALAQAIRDPEQDPNYDPNQEGSCQWRVPVRYLIKLPVASGILIDDIISSQRDLIRSLRQASHIKLLPEESNTARRKLEAARGSEVVEPETPPLAGPWLSGRCLGTDGSSKICIGTSARTGTISTLGMRCLSTLAIKTSASSGTRRLMRSNIALMAGASSCISIWGEAGPCWRVQSQQQWLESGSLSPERA